MWAPNATDVVLDLQSLVLAVAVGAPADGHLEAFLADTLTLICRKEGKGPAATIIAGRTNLPATCSSSDEVEGGGKGGVEARVCDRPSHPVQGRRGDVSTGLFPLHRLSKLPSRIPYTQPAISLLLVLSPLGISITINNYGKNDVII
jgi:hypothetical protein